LKWTHLNTEISHAAFQEERTIHDSTFFQEQFINPTRNKVRLALYQADFYKVVGKWAGEL